MFSKRTLTPQRALISHSIHLGETNTTPLCNQETWNKKSEQIGGEGERGEVNLILHCHVHVNHLQCVRSLRGLNSAGLRDTTLCVDCLSAE